MIISDKFLISALCLSVAIVLQSCSDKSKDIGSGSSGLSLDSTDISLSQKGIDTSSADSILATIDGKSITQSDVDQTIGLKLFDLEWTKYLLRRETLSELVSNAVNDGNSGKSQVKVLIEPPMPPRLDINKEGQPHFGSDSAPITVSIFCSYQSSHCGRMQQTYQKLSDSYPGKINFVFYDFPQSFHRYAKLASYAVRCSGSENFWSFHKALWAKQADLTQDTYQRLVTQLGIDKNEFDNCMSEKKFAQQVQKNIDLADTFGFKNVPVTLINGLYLNGPQDLNVFRFFVDAELERLHLESDGVGEKNKVKPKEQKPKLRLTRTSLPLRLEGILASGQDNVAMIQMLETNVSRNVSQDDELIPGVFVVVVEDKRVILENNGVLEYLDAKGDVLVGQYIDKPEGTPAAISEEGLVSESEEVMMPEGITPEEITNAPDYDFKLRSVVPAQGETPLSKEWVSENLQNQIELASHFEPAEHKVEGVHIMRLKDVSQNDFYQTLGLKNGDVVLRVNNEWVHEAQNNLFASLEDDEQVDVVLMRKGLPIHLKYVIN